MDDSSKTVVVGVKLLSAFKQVIRVTTNGSEE